jgi:hypothetical protein
MTDFSQKQWRISGRKIRMGSQQSNLGIASEGKAGSPHELGKTRRLEIISARGFHQGCIFPTPLASPITITFSAP